MNASATTYRPSAVRESRQRDDGLVDSNDLGRGAGAENGTQPETTIERIWDLPPLPGVA